MTFHQIVWAIMASMIYAIGLGACVLLLVSFLWSVVVIGRTMWRVFKC